MSSRQHGSRKSARPFAASQIADLLLCRALAHFGAPRVNPGEETFRDLTCVARPQKGSTTPAPPAPSTRSRPLLGSDREQFRARERRRRNLSSRGERGISVALPSVFFLAASVALAQAPADLLKLADRPKEAFREAVIHAKITITKGSASESPAEFELYKRGNDGLVVFTAGKQKGRKILTVGEKFWLIVPGSSHAIAVTPNQRLMGGASLADVSKLRFSEEFDAALAGPPEAVDGRECDVLALTPKSAKSSYGGGKVWIDRQEHLARKAVLNLVSGKAAKEIAFDRYGKQDGKTVLESMTIRDLLGGPDAGVTRIDYTNYRAARIDDRFFTPEGALTF